MSEKLLIDFISKSFLGKTQLICYSYNRFASEDIFACKIRKILGNKELNTPRVMMVEKKKRPKVTKISQPC